MYQRYAAAEIKLNSQPWSKVQHKLIDSLQINVIEKWMISVDQGLSDEQIKSQ